MSYSDYLDGLRDGLYIGTRVGFEVGYRVGKISGFLDGYDEGYLDSQCNLPYQPKKRLLETYSILPKIETPKPLKIPDPILPKFETPKPIDLFDTSVKKNHKIKNYWDFDG
ncbi:MAG: hypothetical protein CMF23_16010 [Ignavibacteriae bacterium]|nr:hypothetical protein [Ignavibacteriota bacterium]|tara:strand:+ start:220 stop:552 length:333 start_codon:yes stop_codon:yes gene_type:complete